MNRTEELFNKLPPHYQQFLLDLSKTHQFNHLDPSTYNKPIEYLQKSLAQESGQRPGAESVMNNNLNALRNFGTYFSTGEFPSGGLGIFNMPDYSRIKGYR